MKQVTINVPEGYELKREGNTYTIVEKEFELEVGKDYISKNNEGGVIIDRKGDYDNVGFIKGEFLYNIPCSKPNFWREATEEEIIQAFEKECIRMFGEDWKEVRLKKHANGGTISLNTGRHQVSIRKDKHSGWVVLNKNGLVYCEGKWAEKLEDPIFARSLEGIDRRWFFDDLGNIEEFTGAYQPENHLPTEDLVEGQLALSQLLSFRHDVWEKEGKPEKGQDNWGISFQGRSIRIDILRSYEELFRFKKKETAKWFLKTHRELLTEYQDKLIK